MGRYHRHLALIATLLTTCIFNYGSCRRADGEPASNQAVARRQDGVFFGLGGLDARSMPFDLDAFFEYAAPTRTTRLKKTSPSPSRPQSDRSSDSVSRIGTIASTPVSTSRSSAASDGGHFDSFEEEFQARRRLPTIATTQQQNQQSFVVTQQSAQSFTPVASSDQGRSSARHQQQQTSNRQAFPLNPQSAVRSLPQSIPTQNEPRAQTFATPTRLAVSKEGQGLRARTHNTASLQQRFLPQPLTRHQFEAQASIDQSDAISRLQAPFREDVQAKLALTRQESDQDRPQPKRLLPVQHAPFRPSLPSRLQQQLSTTEESPVPTSTFDNEQRFVQNQIPVRRPGQKNEARARFQIPVVRDESSSDETHLYNNDNRRPFTTNDQQQQFQPETQFRARPIDSLEKPQDDNFSEDVDQIYQTEQEEPLPQRTPATRLTYNQATSDDDIFDGPNQNGPPQGVDEEDTNDFNDDTELLEHNSRQPQNLRPQKPSHIYQPEAADEQQQTSQLSDNESNLDSQPLQRRPPTRLFNPQLHRGNFEVPQTVALRPPVVQTTTVTPQPSLSHRGVSGVVSSPQLKRPEAPVRPRPIGVQTVHRQRLTNEDFNQHFRTQQILPNTRDFNEQPLPESTTAKARLRDFQVTPPQQQNFHQFRGQLRPIPIQTTQTNDEVQIFSDKRFQEHLRPIQTTQANDEVQTFPDKRPALSHSARPAIQSLTPVRLQHTTSSSPYFPSNLESTGQISPSFVRATEPTRFVQESERPFSDVSLNFTRDIGGAIRNRLLTTLRRRPAVRPETAYDTQPAIETEFNFDPPPQSTIAAVSAEFQRPLTHAGQLARVTVPSVNDNYPVRRISSSTPKTSLKTAAKLIDRERSPIINRGSKRGPLLKGRTRVQHVTENTIDDIGYQNSLSSRGRDGPQPEQDTKLSAVVSPGQVATTCDPSACQLPKCFCGGNQIRPGNLRPEDTPQIVLLTFDDAVNDLNWALYTRLFFQDRKNPNGCPIKSTFYVSHEWTDYSKVQNLYSAGHEIASHSISHGDGRDYSKKKWYNEIYGQKEILSVYANVNLDDIKGMRSPFLAMGGDKQFSMLYETNFTYESSMTVTDVHPPYWPYTLDYAMPHRCAIPPCPKLSYPGFWEIPMVALTDLNGGKCSMADSCSFATTEDGIFEMLMKNFDRHYTSNRAPFGLYYHASWFLVPHRQEGFVKFLDEILKKDDVYFITSQQLLDWMRNPTPLSKINEFEPWLCYNKQTVPPCNRPRSCELRFKGDVRYMSTCNSCPNAYPWVEDTGVTKHVHTINP